VTAFLHRITDRLGPTGVIALGLIVFAVSFYVATVSPLRSRLAETQAKANALLARLPTASKTVAVSTGPRNVGERIDAYYGSFPGIDELPSAISDTLDSAKAHSLSINQAEYRYEPGRKDELIAYRMGFTVKGPYARVRGFLVELLQNNPALSIDELNLRRDAIASPEIEAKVQLTFYVTTVPWNRQNAAAG